MPSIFVKRRQEERKRKLEKAIKLWEEGFALVEIAEAVGLTTHIIRPALRKAGFELKHQRRTAGSSATHYGLNSNPKENRND